MKLLGSLASPYVLRVVMFAQLKGIDLPLEEFPGEGVKSPESLAINPIGRMPVLALGDRYLAESSIICGYLDDVAAPAAMPEDPYERARSKLIDRIVDLYVAPPVRPLFAQLNPATRDETLLNEAAAELTAGIGYVQHFMGNTGPFVSGNTPTLGDCALASYTAVLKQVVFANLEQVPDFTTTSDRMSAWWAAVNEQPNLANTLEAYEKALATFLATMGR